MTDSVAEFEQLLKDMEHAIVTNNVQQVNELVAKQQACILELVHMAKGNQELKEHVRTRYPGLVRQLRVNEQLLQQGLSIANAIVFEIYQSSHPLNISSDRVTNRTYSA